MARCGACTAKENDARAQAQAETDKLVRRHEQELGEQAILLHEMQQRMMWMQEDNDRCAPLRAFLRVCEWPCACACVSLFWGSPAVSSGVGWCSIDRERRRALATIQRSALASCHRDRLSALCPFCVIINVLIALAHHRRLICCVCHWRTCSAAIDR